MNGFTGLSCPSCGCLASTEVQHSILPLSTDVTKIYFAEVSINKEWIDANNVTDAWVVFEQFYSIIGGNKMNFLSSPNCGDTGHKLLLISSNESNKINNANDPRAYCASVTTASAAKESELERLIVQSPNSDRIRFAIDVWHNEYEKTVNGYGISKTRQLFEQLSPEPNFPYIINLDLSVNNDTAESNFIHKSSFPIIRDTVFDVIPNLEKRWSIEFDLKVIPDLLPNPHLKRYYGNVWLSVIVVRPQYTDNVPIKKDETNKEVFPHYSVVIDSEQTIYLCYCKDGGNGCSLSQYNLMGMRVYRDNNEYYEEYDRYYNDSMAFHSGGSNFEYCSQSSVESKLFYIWWILTCNCS